MQKTFLAVGALVLASVFLVPSAHAQLSGAIFTTLSDGSEVNFNIYANQADVYLDGGPGPGAPQEAAGLPDGTYVFMVTDPSGKVLLSTDNAECRRFVVTGGVITSVVTTGGCEHATGFDVDHGAATVQLIPYNDTPNPGGEYKVWVTPAEQYLCSLVVVDCGEGTHGFDPRWSKTDNFKVKVTPIIEIDTSFFSNGKYIDGPGITWIDTHGASNRKWSYYRPDLFVFHEAHVEAPEAGVHKIVIEPQPLCPVIGDVYLQGKRLGRGPQTVKVRISPNYRKALSVFVFVDCH